MRITLVKSSLLALCLSLFATSLYAVPGGDTAIVLKLVAQIKQMKKQYELLDNSYKQAERQLNSMDKLKQYNSGHSGFGNLHNSLPDLNKRQSANTWRESLKGVSGGNPERYKELVGAYEQHHARLNPQQFRKGASSVRAERFEQDKEVAKAASIESEVAFNDINESMKRIHDLSDQIEKAEHTKAAIDLNSRLLTEIAYLQAQNLKAQSVLNQQLAHKSGGSLGDEAELSRYLTLDKK